MLGKAYWLIVLLKYCLSNLYIFVLKSTHEYTAWDWIYIICNLVVCANESLLQFSYMKMGRNLDVQKNIKVYAMSQYLYCYITVFIFFSIHENTVTAYINWNSWFCYSIVQTLITEWNNTSALMYHIPLEMAVRFIEMVGQRIILFTKSNSCY